MESFSMPPIPCMISLGSERALQRDDPQGDYLDRVNQHRGLPIYDSKKNDSFYEDSPAFEMPRFYSEEEGDDTQILPSQKYAPSMPVADKSGHVDTGLPCFSSESNLPVKPPAASLPARSTRKRSLTNLFKAKPETIILAMKTELNPPGIEPPVATSVPRTCSTPNETNSQISALIDEQASYLKRIVLAEPNVGTIPSSICQRLNFCQREEEIFYENEVLAGSSLLSTAQVIQILNQYKPSHEASQASISKAAHLSQARTNLKTRSVNRSITVGYQPCKEGFTAKDENIYYQRIWKHLENRVEAHDRMKCTLEMISEEEENRENLK
ncbi:hypothetical protein PGT21_005517 [Puccinia graminis f. sp. tritici]|uniref:Uncharacterized protein n=2 Tax=Puccinia graminis f. sp. tritici TaxID=56615 RepID=E3KFV1_PUCGT|nr:uncharacterized protein PGTG_09189 [Puccinia graminis f. sp. tritici CRL 75-36-700-3]EFP83236.1 hypothetical protein PGTG_09189 [Puccinia graminis f. sp. tritici CRL 75-36-700-3]KAA1089066.1 hypothetical protein PGT21_005517 [Puccinia graminis f. sp. tritici]